MRGGADAPLNRDLVTGLAAARGEINPLSCLWWHSYTVLAFWQRLIILLTKREDEEKKNSPSADGSIASVERNT